MSETLNKRSIPRRRRSGERHVQRTTHDATNTNSSSSSSSIEEGNNNNEISAATAMARRDGGCSGTNNWPNDGSEQRYISGAEEELSRHNDDDNNSNNSNRVKTVRAPSPPTTLSQWQGALHTDPLHDHQHQREGEEEDDEDDNNDNNSNNSATDVNGPDAMAESGHDFSAPAYRDYYYDSVGPDTANSMSLASGSSRSPSAQQKLASSSHTETRLLRPHHRPSDDDSTSNNCSSRRDPSAALEPPTTASDDDGDDDAAVVLEELCDDADADGDGDGDGDSGTCPHEQQRCVCCRRRHCPHVLCSTYPPNDSETRAYTREMVRSLLPACVAAALETRVGRVLLRWLQLYLSPLSPRMDAFEAPLPPREEEKKQRVWAEQLDRHTADDRESEGEGSSASSEEEAESVETAAAATEAISTGIAGAFSLGFV